jgi:isoprenylcysteine carboxyl methyltransferase (ICMT) family protein YpbQ
VTTTIMISTTMAVVVTQRLEELEIALRAERERAEQREATQRRDARAAAEVSH